MMAEEKESYTPGDVGPGLTVLHIDDSATVRTLVQRLVERSGMGFLGAQDGGTGLELARLHVPALILLDVNLPDMSGDEVLDSLRQDQTTAAIPVVVLSGEAHQDDIERMRAAGAADYIVKPVRVEKLLHTLERFVGVQTTAGETPARSIETRPSLSDLLATGERLREAVAGALHDDAMQALSALHLGLQMLDGGRSDPAILELQDIAEKGIAALRRLVLDLRPPPFPRRGLSDALNGYLKSLDVEAQDLVDDRLGWEPSAEIATIAYRIVQEIVVVLRAAGYGFREVVLEDVDGAMLVRLVVDGEKPAPELLTGIASSLPSRPWLRAFGAAVDVIGDEGVIELRLPRDRDAASPAKEEDAP